MSELRVKVEDQVSPLLGMNHPSPDTGISGCGLGDVMEKVSEKLENFQEYLGNIWKGALGRRQDFPLHPGCGEHPRIALLHLGVPGHYRCQLHGHQGLPWQLLQLGLCS